MDGKIIDEIIGKIEQETKTTVKDYRAVPALIFSEVEIDAAERRVIYKRQDIRMTAMEFDVLYFLATHKEQVCSPRIIYEAVSKDSYMAGEYIIKNIIYRLRKKLYPEIIETVRGYGYRFKGK